MLTRKADAQMEFDIDQAVAQTRENPVFYVQYAHARCRSVLRAAQGDARRGGGGAESLAGVALDSLDHEAELALLRRLGGWPRTVEAAALAREPHRIAFFLYDLAADFHMLWNRGRDDCGTAVPAVRPPGRDARAGGPGGRHGDDDPVRSGRHGSDPGRGDALTPALPWGGGARRLPRHA